jgi:hypothetical protein
MVTLDRRAENELMAAIEAWVSRHPRAKAATVHVRGKDYSPKQILTELQQGSETGDLFMKVLRGSLSKQSMEEILRLFHPVESGGTISGR